MACESRLAAGQTLQDRMREVAAALADVRRLLQSGAVRVRIAPNGAVMFEGWEETARRGLSDACTYRALAAENSWELRQAVARAEAQGGRRVNVTAVAAGWHSHDAGKTWGKH